jgi:hypothetical protein
MRFPNIQTLLLGALTLATKACALDVNLNPTREHIVKRPIATPPLIYAFSLTACPASKEICIKTYKIASKLRVVYCTVLRL